LPRWSVSQRLRRAATEKAPEPPPAPKSTAESAATTKESAATGPQAAAYPTDACFGDTHVHTGWSADAGMDGAILTPEDAYRFARGEEMKSSSGIPAKLGRRYDWFMITDHSDALGVINEPIAGNPE
jgi:Protein of unknown function (DUF3604)